MVIKQILIVLAFGEQMIILKCKFCGSINIIQYEDRFKCIECKKSNEMYEIKFEITTMDKINEFIQNIQIST